MSYTRVIPRDLFNEAKLLKCLGQLALLIHDNNRFGVALEHDEEPDRGFVIEQDRSSGALLCSNLSCYCNGRLIGLRSPYNSKEPYPLTFILEDNEGQVFNPDGTFHVEFIVLLKSTA